MPDAELTIAEIHDGLRAEQLSCHALVEQSLRRIKETDGRLGAFLRGEDWQKTKMEWEQLLHNFHWHQLASKTVLNNVCSILLGYFVVSLVLGILAYVLALNFFNSRKDKKIL